MLPPTFPTAVRNPRDGAFGVWQTRAIFGCRPSGCRFVPVWVTLLTGSGVCFCRHIALAVRAGYRPRRQVS